MTVHAPFRFARIPRFVYMPDWAEFVSHDVPFADGVSGEVDIEIRTETPLLVGGRRRKATDKRRGEVWPFEIIKDGKGQYAIPPSSLQGMVRSILEIATFGRLGSFVDDRRFGIRELTPKAVPYYQRRLIDTERSEAGILAAQPRIRAGWLRFHEGRFQFEKCKLARIEYGELERLTNSAVKALGAPYVPAYTANNRLDVEENIRRHNAIADAARNSTNWLRKSSARERYALVTNKALLYRSLFVDDAAKYHLHNRKSGDRQAFVDIKYRKAHFTNQAHATEKTGNVILTGVTAGIKKIRPEDRRRTPQSGKHMEFYFYDRGKTLELGPDFAAGPFLDFLHVHQPAVFDCWQKVILKAKDAHAPLLATRAILNVRDDDGATNDTWKFFRDRGYPGSEGNSVSFKSGGWMPIFYIGKDNEQGIPKIEAFGLAYMFKLAHECSTHQMLENSCRDHRLPKSGKQAQLDLPSTIFGAIADLNETEARSAGLKRRANFDFAVATTHPETVSNRDNGNESPLVLATPKPSYYPAYVRQHANPATPSTLAANSSYATYTSLPNNGVAHTSPELAGVKIWPASIQASAKHNLNQNLPQLDPTVSANQKVQVVLNAVPKDIIFTTKLRFHNLRPIELGAILWALTYGDNNALANNYGIRVHRLGMGKPVGLGHLAIRIRELSVYAINEIKDKTPKAFVDAFETHMTEQYRLPNCCGPDKEWKKSPQVAALLKASDPAANVDEDLRYMTLTMRPENKNDFQDEKGRKVNDPSRFMASYVPSGAEAHEKPR